MSTSKTIFLLTFGHNNYYSGAEKGGWKRTYKYSATAVIGYNCYKLLWV